MRVDLKFDENIQSKKNNDLIKLQEFLGGFSKDLFVIEEYTFSIHGKKIDMFLHLRQLAVQ